MNRRDFLQRSALAAASMTVLPGWADDSKQPFPPDETVLADARKRIASHRVGRGTIKVHDQSGKAIRGARLKIEQTRHDFLFGSNFFMFARHNDPKLEEPYRQRFSDLLNFATHGFYWADYEREPGNPRYAYTDDVVDFCRQQNITCKGHPLVWDHSVSTPSWLPTDLKEVEKLSRSRVRDIVSRYRGDINIWDVVNEATHLYEIKNKSVMDELGMAMGQVEFVGEHVKIAREANPDALLLVNDYKIGPNYYELLDKIREDGSLLFDAVGIQSHMHRGVWPMKKTLETCDTFAKLGLPIHFTETTVVSGKKVDAQTWGPSTPEAEEKQARQVIDLYTVLFGHPAVEAITWWDFSDYGAWQGAPSGWLRRDMSPKPVYERLLALLKGEWWTRTERQTDRRGNCAFEGFYGDYRVTATLPNGRQFSKEFPWRRDMAHTKVELAI